MPEPIPESRIREMSAGPEMSTGAGRTFRHLPLALDAAHQVKMVAVIHDILRLAPPFQPTMPRTGTPFSVRMSNCGPLGWVSDKAGYRYQATHPETGQPWPPMPQDLLTLWHGLANCPATPEACLINIYEGKAKMGSHQDRDETDFSSPVLSLSLGDDAVFHVGGLRRSDPKTRLTLRSGDVVLLEGASRLAFHGIDRVLPHTSALLPGGGRINLTLRRVTAV